MRSSLLPLLALCWLGLVQALSSSGSRLLVIIDDVAERTKYSQFWDDLRDRGFSLSFQTPKSNTALFRHGEKAFDHLLILPSKLKALGPSLTPALLLDFLKADGNILLGLSSETATPNAIVSLLLELDIHLPTDRSSLVVDHFHHDTLTGGEAHDVLLVPAPKPIRNDVYNFFGSDNGVLAVPRAVGQTLGATSALLAPILSAPATAYTYNPKEDSSEGMEDVFAVGAQLALVSAMQARNSARFTVLGSTEMLEDRWFAATVKSQTGGELVTGNRQFAASLSGWAFKELGVLKAGLVRHYLNETPGRSSAPNATFLGQSALNPKIYRIKNDVTFTIEVSEYVNDHYAPFVPPASDELQLEFSMLSPFHRVPLVPTLQTPNATVFAASLRLPDQHGIFNFRVNYKRPFLTAVDEKHTVTVRHFAHDEWPRSYDISGAWVWIAGIWTTVAGWLVFVAVWLWSAPVEEKRKIKKAQ